MARSEKEYSSVTIGFVFECLLKCGLKVYQNWTEESVIGKRSC